MFSLSPLRVADVPEMVRVYNSFFEDARWPEPYFTRILNRKNICGLKAEADGKLIGIHLTVQGVHFTNAHAELYHTVSVKTAGMNVYTGDMVFVDPAYRGEGVAEALIKAAKSAMRDMGVELMLTECVVDPKGRCPGLIAGRYFELYEDFGFFPNFYAHEVIDTPCLVCHQNPCVCGVRVLLYKV